MPCDRAKDKRKDKDTRRTGRYQWPLKRALGELQRKASERRTRLLVQTDRLESAVNKMCPILMERVSSGPRVVTRTNLCDQARPHEETRATNVVIRSSSCDHALVV